LGRPWGRRDISFEAPAAAPATVLQCESCCEYSLEDLVMQRVDEILQRADTRAELEIIRYAA
jgi:hypothetical protein